MKSIIDGLLRIPACVQIIFIAFIALITMSRPGWAGEAADCSPILNGIPSPYAEQSPLRGAIAYCAYHRVSIDYGSSGEDVQLDINIMDLGVRDEYQFSGLAGYYNAVKIIPLEPEAWFAVTGRFDALLLNAPGAVLKVEGDFMHFSWPANMPVILNVVSGNKTEVASRNPDYDAIRYNHLWGWLASLAKLVEWTLIKIQKNVIEGWGWAVLLLAICMKVLLLPIAVITVRAQRQVSQYKAVLEPRLIEIKKNFDGAEAHERIMEAHKALGITPFYTLKPLLASLIQIPVLIAVFNALGEMPQFKGESFLWVENLAYPDAIGELPFHLPVFGDKISLLPFIMTITTILSTTLFQSPLAEAGEAGRQKYGLNFMAFAFFILFYPFPAVMVLYWAFINMLHIVQQRIIGI
jgi:YidC/Oxa1 family membrane protein insertase